MGASYVVQDWRETAAGHPSITVVDGRGRRAHVTIPRHLTTGANVQQVVAHVLDNRPAEHPDRERYGHG